VHNIAAPAAVCNYRIVREPRGLYSQRHVRRFFLRVARQDSRAATRLSPRSLRQRLRARVCVCVYGRRRRRRYYHCLDVRE